MQVYTKIAKLKPPINFYSIIANNKVPPTFPAIRYLNTLGQSIPEEVSSPLKDVSNTPVNKRGN